MIDPAVSPVDAGALKVFQALADDNRLRILDALRHGERCVCELQEDLGLGQSLLSHHLRVLREGGLVLDRREGRWVHYSLCVEALEELESHLRRLREPSDAPRFPAPGCQP